MIPFVLASVISWMGLTEVRGGTATLIPSADTTLFEKFPGNNLGGEDDVVSGTVASGERTRALLRFDIAGAIPAGATIDSVALTVTVTKVPPGSVSSTYDLRRVLVNWGEGTKGGNVGSPASAGEASWNARLTSTAMWTTAGGGIGSDFASTVSGSQSIGPSGAFTFSSTAGLVADVQAWLDNPSSNFGWVLMSQSEGAARSAHRLGSSENTLRPPRLVVNFTLPPRIDRAEVAENRFRIHFQAEAGSSYVVERRPLVHTGAWTVITNLPVQNASGPVVVSDELGTGAAFYRVGRQ
jgi:hypothetical protein